MKRIMLASFALVIGWGAVAHAQDGLTKAYQKEFAFLEAEKAALQARKDKVKAEARRDEGRLKAEIAGLQRRLINMRERADALDTELREANDSAERSEAADDVIGEVLLRAGESLRKHGMEPPPPVSDENRAADSDKALDVVFARGLSVIDRNHKVRVVDGEFFAADGNRVQGKLVHVGAIATYGVNDAAAGPLLPAGAGHLTLAPNTSPVTAHALAAGDRPALLPVFLHESLDKPIPPAKDKTVGDFLAAGGIIGWVIVGLGILAMLMLIARALILAFSSGGTRLIAEVETLIEAGKTRHALALAESRRGPLARVLTATIKHLGHKREQLEDMVSEALLGEQSKLERFATAITASAAVAPLLGLLGTVAGMIATFDIITEHGTGDPKLLSGGISEALVTTELGLIVAIPTLLLGSVLAARADAITNVLERAALRVMNTAAIAEHAATVPITASVVERATAREESEQTEAAPATPSAAQLAGESAA